MIAIENAKIYTMGKIEIIEKGSIVFEEKKGKIKKVGKNIRIPKNCKVVNGDGKVVMPGMIDAHCHLGAFEEGEGHPGLDINEKTDPVTPHLRIIDSINPFDLGFNDAIRAGITTVNISPGSSNVICGQQAAIKTGGSKIVDNLIIKSPTGIKMALGENPKKVYEKKDETPSTRMGTAGTIRKTLFEVKNYIKRLEKEENIERNFKYESLIPLLNKKIPARVHAHRADDIITGVRISKEYGFDLYVEHCTEGHKIADFLSKNNIPTVVGPSLTSRSKRELKERTFKTAGILSKKGVKVSITSDAPVVPIQYLPLMAAYAVREGMKEVEALKSITINPAEICGIDNKVGSLETGKDADLIILDGEPLELKSKVEKVFINGKRQEFNEKIDTY